MKFCKIFDHTKNVSTSIQLIFCYLGLLVYMKINTLLKNYNSKHRLISAFETFIKLLRLLCDIFK